jgi:hypothetical protein
VTLAIETIRAAMRREPWRVQVVALVAIDALTRVGVHIGPLAELSIDAAAYWFAAEIGRLFTRPTTPKPSAAAKPARNPPSQLPSQLQEQPPMFDLAGFFTTTFETPLATLVKEGEEFFSEDARNLVAQAQADLEVARQAAATAVASKAAALDAFAKEHVDAIISAAADKAPIVGPLLKGEATAIANSATDAVLGGAIARLQALLSGH